MSLCKQVRACCWLIVSVLFFWGVAQAAPRAGVIIDAAAPEVEQFAARELCGYLVKLFGVQTRPLRSVTPSAEMVFLIGSPQTNPAVEQASESKAFPKATDHGIVLRRTTGGNRPRLIVGGGSPRATLWAVYELVERWGVRYRSDRDVLPQKIVNFTIPDLDVMMEPIFQIRAHPTVQDSVASGEAWGIADFRRLIDQLAKMKGTRINIYTFGWQPFLHWEYGGVKRRSAHLWHDYHYPITPDTKERELFGARGAQAKRCRGNRAGEPAVSGIVPAPVVCQNLGLLIRSFSAHRTQYRDALRHSKQSIETLAPAREWTRCSRFARICVAISAMLSTATRNHDDGYFTANRSAIPTSQRKRENRISEPLNGYRPVVGLLPDTGWAQRHWLLVRHTVAVNTNG